MHILYKNGKKTEESGPQTQALTNIGLVDGKVAVFAFDSDTECCKEPNAQTKALIQDVYNFVAANVRRLPDIERRCDQTTRACMKSVNTKHPEATPVWLRLGENMSDDNFHRHVGALHQVPWVVYEGNIYFFDFCNFFGKDIKGTTTSVVVFPADKNCFKKMMDLTGSNYAVIEQIGKLTADRGEVGYEYSKEIDQLPRISDNIYCNGSYNENAAEALLAKFNLIQSAAPAPYLT